MSRISPAFALLAVLYLASAIRDDPILIQVTHLALLGIVFIFDRREP